MVKISTGRQRRPRWTPAEEAALTRYVRRGYTLSQMADHLWASFGTRRTPMAIDAKLYRLRVERHPRGWRSCNGVARALGVEWRTVWRWIMTDRLEARKTTTRAGHESFWWHVRDAHLERFVTTYAGRLFSAETVCDPALKARADVASTVRRGVR